MSDDDFEREPISEELSTTEQPDMHPASPRTQDLDKEQERAKTGAYLRDEYNKLKDTISLQRVSDFMKIAASIQPNDHDAVLEAFGLAELKHTNPSQAGRMLRVLEIAFRPYWKAGKLQIADLTAADILLDLNNAITRAPGEDPDLEQFDQKWTKNETWAQQHAE